MISEVKKGDVRICRGIGICAVLTTPLDDKNFTIALPNREAIGVTKETLIESKLVKNFSDVWDALVYLDKYESGYPVHRINKDN